MAQSNKDARSALLKCWLVDGPLPIPDICNIIDMYYRQFEGTYLHKLEGHNGPVVALAVLRNGHIVSGSYDRTIRIWPNGAVIGPRILVGHTERISAVTVMPLNAMEDYIISGTIEDYIISGSDDTKIRVWNATTGTCLHILAGHTGRVNAIVAIDNEKFASCSDDYTVRIWDIINGSCLLVLEGHTRVVNALAVVGGHLVSGSSDTTLRVWNTDNGTCLHRLTGHTDAVSTLTVLPSGKLLSGAYDMAPRVWDIANTVSGVSENAFGNNRVWIDSVAILDDGRLAVGSCENTVYIRDATSGEFLLELAGNSDWTRVLMVLPDGNLVSGSQDGKVCIWT